MGSFVVTLTDEEAKRLGMKPKPAPKPDKGAMPAKVPILKAKDICKGAYTKGAKHDLTGWRNMVVYGKDQALSAPTDKAVMKFTKAIRDAIKTIRPTFSEATQISDFNDSSSTKPSEIAAVWNKAMLALGYDATGVLVAKAKPKKSKEK